MHQNLTVNDKNMLTSIDDLIDKHNNKISSQNKNLDQHIKKSKTGSYLTYTLMFITLIIFFITYFLMKIT